MGAVLSSIVSNIASEACACRDWAKYVFNDCDCKSSCLREGDDSCCDFEVHTHPVEFDDDAIIEPQ